MEVEESVDFGVCRICLGKKECSDFTKLGLGEPSHQVKLCSLVPDMDTDLIEDPVICESCVVELKSAFAFKQKCLETEHKLSIYKDNEQLKTINLLDALEKIPNVACESLYIKQEYEDLDINEEITKSDSDHRKKSNSPIRFECLFCKKLLKTKAALTKHLTTHKCSKCQDVFCDNEALNSHKCRRDSDDRESECRCDDCGKILKSKHHLLRHSKLHSKQETFLCAICGISFNNQSKLKHHMKKHSNEKPHKCETCGVGFNHRSSLKVHKRIHAGDITDEKSLENIFTCNICNQHFYDKNYLHKHSKIHGDKIFACDLCNKKFNNKGDLGKHRRIHTGEKPYLCKFCGMRFRVSASLIRHTRAHTGEKPYVCETCGKCFNQKYNLNSHMKIHSGLKPYVCDGCDKSFSHKATLDSHILKTHSNGQLYKCNVCFRCFSCDENLSLHKDEHKEDVKI